MSSVPYPSAGPMPALSPPRKTPNGSTPSRHSGKEPDTGSVLHTISEMVKAGIELVWLAIYSVVTLVVTAGTMILTIVAPPLALFATIALIGLVLNLAGVVFHGLGLVH